MIAADPTRLIERLIPAPIECTTLPVAHRTVRATRRALDTDVTFMWILVAEALGALGLFLFIVWWTLGPTQRREREMLDGLAREARDRQRAPRDAAAGAPTAAAPDEGSTGRP